MPETKVQVERRDRDTLAKLLNMAMSVVGRVRGVEFSVKQSQDNNVIFRFKYPLSSKSDVVEYLNEIGVPDAETSE